MFKEQDNFLNEHVAQAFNDGQGFPPNKLAAIPTNRDMCQ